MLTYDPCYNTVSLRVSGYTDNLISRTNALCRSRVGPTASLFS